MSDLISRQAAIDALKEEEYPCESDYDEGYMAALDKAVWIIEKWLPSAQQEIIRCKDCKHWDGVDTCDVIDAPVWDNDFCSMAERRSDEE